jgi:UDP-N-acetylglucosamine 4,6-dehydratase
MCPADDSHLTLEFHDHFVIRPTIQFVNEVNFTMNRCGESGRPVDQGIEYQSGNNPHFLTVQQIVAMNQSAGMS